MSTPNPTPGWATPNSERPQAPATPGNQAAPGQATAGQAGPGPAVTHPYAYAASHTPNATGGTAGTGTAGTAAPAAPTQPAPTAHQHPAPTAHQHPAPTAHQRPAYQAATGTQAPYQGATGVRPPYQGGVRTQTPYQGAASTHATSHGNGSAGAAPPPSTFGPGSGWQSPPPAPATTVKRPRTWLAITAAAVLAAGLASGGTAALLQNTSSSGTLTQADAPVTVPVSADGSPDWEAVAAQVRPSVVAITFSSSAGSGAGSGVIIDSSGLILTNNHVVADAQSLTVTLSDGRIFEARIVGTDPTTDLAVIELTDAPDDLEAATLGSSDDLAVGESVMAVGNPLGLDSTVTTGIISALDRPVSATGGGQAQDAVVTNAIQIDAAVNPGNSGGPLFDANGRVIGITSSIATLSESSGSIGLGFAIPVDLATNVADQLIADGTAEHAYLGVSLTDDTATADGVTRTGAAVAQVGDGTPAAEAGLQEGDVIVQIDDHAVSGAESLTGWVRTYNSGDTVTLTVIRGGDSIEVETTLASREAAS
ncbi:trypsin-like peptidase domain-containing protein [Occultella kanbiaonis]|uniref:trypsin-like peptidase domain-containing protein n=1 Tax=Occultella kanbiaonis TaxID=2675754 RepID=UPI001F42B8D3|nr:trypsin-like peptidase domain-containing protein [Occultella kanbiaonis]